VNTATIHFGLLQPVRNSVKRSRGFARSPVTARIMQPRFTPAVSAKGAVPISHRVLAAPSKPKNIVRGIAGLSITDRTNRGLVSNVAPNSSRYPRSGARINGSVPERVWGIPDAVPRLREPEIRRNTAYSAVIVFSLSTANKASGKDFATAPVRPGGGTAMRLSSPASGYSPIGF